VAEADFVKRLFLCLGPFQLLLVREGLPGHIPELQQLEAPHHLAQCQLTVVDMVALPHQITVVEVAQT
jgi:hypothetical protein